MSHDDRFDASAPDAPEGPHGEQPFVPAVAVDAPHQQPPRRGGLMTVLAWVLIVLVVGTIVSRPWSEPPAQPLVEDNSASFMLDMQGKYIVAVASLPSISTDHQLRQLYDQSQMYNRGSVGDRICFVVLAGELVGAEEAFVQLEALDKLLMRKGVEPTPRQQRLLEILGSLYGDYTRRQWEAPSLDAPQRELLVGELGWFGRLALAPREGSDTAARQAVMRPAFRVLAAMFVFLATIGVLGVSGIVGAVLFVVFFFQKKIHFRFSTGSRFGGVYIETFALWMLVYVLLGVGVALLPNTGNEMLVQNVVMITSAAVLVWPLLRGASFSQMCDDLGLRAQRPLREVMWGVVCYASTLPLLLMLALMVIAAVIASQFAAPVDELAPLEMPSHPIVQWMRESSWWGRLQVIVAACILAPLIEETMFRGLLYRHLRQCTAHWRVVSSVLFSAGFNAFIFAIIHPQGIVAVPVLMALAIGFSLAREWRGSLLAPMTAHAMNNTIVTILLLALL